MEQLASPFLSTVAQVSATFIGFALLTPIFQAVASGPPAPGERYILRKKFLMKWLALLLLPIFTLGYPFILSLFLLRFDTNLTTTGCYTWISIAFGLSVLFYFRAVKKWSKLMGWKEPTKSKDELKEGVTMDITKTIIFRRFVECIPPLLLIFCLCMWGSNLTPFSFHRPGILLIIVVIVGFLFIIRNLGVKFDEGIVFRRSEISRKFKETKNEFVNRIDKAVEKRGKVLEEMRQLSNQHKEDRELKRSIGYHEGEIENLRILQGKIKELYDQIANKNDVTFEDFLKFEGWRENGEGRIEEFERGTVIAKNVLESR